MNYNIKYPENNGGMNERIKRLRQQNFDTPTTLSIERALIETVAPFWELLKKTLADVPVK